MKNTTGNHNHHYIRRLIIKHKKSSKVISLLALVVILLAATSCARGARVGELQTESQSVELGDAESVRVEIDLGAGDLEVAGGAEKLLEADFTYNVAELKPEVAYSAGTLVVRQPEVQGLPALTGITGYRYEWDLRLHDDVPMDLSVDMGAGKSDLKLAGLSLTTLDINVGAGESTVDLSGDWARDLDVSIKGGAGRLTVRLPGNVGTRVAVDGGLGSINASGLNRDGDIYTNDAYGESAVTLHIDIEGGVGEINMELEPPIAADSQGTEAATPGYASITGELSQLIQAAVEEAGITGLSVALVDDQEIVWSEGFGYADKEKGVKATPETVYGVASISKLFTAAAIMQLAEQGRIDIDQPLQTYVPEFSINSRFPGADPMTPRSLLTHHSGLPSDLTNGMAAFGDDQEALTRSEFHNLENEIKQAHATNPPNTAFSYSNLGYSLLGLAVEQVTGQEFSDYMDQTLLGPMGMDSSSFTLRPDMKPRLSKEYLNGEEQEFYWSRDIPAASLRSSVEDLSRFMMMVFGDGELGGQRILRAETVTEMLSPQNSDVALDFDARWGLSWWLIPLPGLDHAGKIAWHSGGEGMWNSLLVTLPDHKLGVVVLSNSGEAGLAIEATIATTILEQALAAKAGIERPPAEPPDVVALSPDELLSYEGLYTTDLGWMNLRVDGTDLYADAMGQSFKLLPHGEGRFSIEGVPASDAQVAIKEVNGRTALNLYGFAVGGLGYGERVEPSTVPQAWMDRLGSYEITNGKPGFLTFLTDVQLKYENDFLMLDVTRSDTGEQFVFPIGPLSDDEAVILGLGQRRGETVSVVDVDGEEQLFYSGYLMKKLGTAELLQRVLEAAVESPDTSYPGAVLHVSSPELGSWTGAAGLGDIETNTPMRPQDKFRAGSLTKPFIAAVVLQLVEEGRFSLDDPMTAVLPESITSKFANSDQITVRMLLNHTGGLPDFMDLAGPEIMANLTKLWEAEEFLDFAAAQEPWFAPGEAQGYSNTDYILLGMVIEEATGQSWRDEMRQRIFEPLNLENTLLPEPNDTTIPGDHARGYADFGAGLVDATELANASVVGAPGGQSMVTNAEDLSRFVNALLAGELFQEAGTLDEMLTFVDWPDGNPLSPYLDGYGLGLAKADFGSGIEGVGHSGDTEGGYTVFVFHLPAQDMTISGAVNTFDPRAGFLLIPRALEVLVPGYSAPAPEEEQPALAGAVYEDPEGRFTLPLIGDWAQVEADGPYALFEVPGLDLNMYVVTVESDDLEVGAEAALRQIGIDPSALAKTNETKLGDWYITFYSLGERQGVTPLCQVEDKVTYCLIATGDEGLTQNPPEHVMKTIQGFAIAGKETTLPSTIEDFEAYVNSFVGISRRGYRS